MSTVTNRVCASPPNLNNVMVDLTVEIGRRYVTLGQAKALREQDVVQLDKLCGEAFDVLVNDQAFAEAEIVVVTDLVAARITRMRDCE